MQSKRRSALILWLVFLVIVLGIVVLMVRGSRIKPEQKPVPPEPSVPIAVMRLAPASVNNAIVLPGKLEPFADYQVPVVVPGAVTKIKADRGDLVKKGAWLLQVDDSIWREMRRQAEVDLREADKELVRRKGLHDSGAVSVSDLDAFQTRREMAEIALNRARIQVDRCRIESPSDGLVNDRLVDVGEYAREGDPVFQVLQLDPMKLMLNIPEQNITSLRAGDPIRFTVDAYPGTVFTARVSFVAAQSSPMSHAFPAEALTDNPGLLLRAGMIARVELDLGLLDNVILAPLAAIVPDKGDHVAYVVVDGRAQRRLVKLDGIRGSQALIASGLDAGDLLVVEGQRSLADGALLETLKTIEP